MSDAGEERRTTAHDRYTVSDGVVGFVDSSRYRDDAVEIAARHARRTGDAHTVFDRMARRGAVQTWHVNDAGIVFKTERREA